MCEFFSACSANPQKEIRNQYPSLSSGAPDFSIFNRFSGVLGICSAVYLCPLFEKKRAFSRTNRPH